MRASPLPPQHSARRPLAPAQSAATASPAGTTAATAGHRKAECNGCRCFEQRATLRVQAACSPPALVKACCLDTLLTPQDSQVRAPTLATVPCTVATASSSPGCVCAATHSGRPQSAVRRLAILQHTHAHTLVVRPSAHNPQTPPPPCHTTTTTALQAQCPHLHSRSALSSATPQDSRLLTWRVCVYVCARLAAAPHLLGLGLQRCHTLLPSAAAYLRSLHQPGICCRVAPKMRKRPTSCTTRQHNTHRQHSQQAGAAACSARHAARKRCCGLRTNPTPGSTANSHTDTGKAGGSCALSCCAHPAAAAARHTHDVTLRHH